MCKKIKVLSEFNIKCCKLKNKVLPVWFCINIIGGGGGLSFFKKIHHQIKMIQSFI
jgi:hypothetical protein